MPGRVPPPRLRASSTTGVQSVNRALTLLEVVESAGGQLPIGEIAAACDIPVPTIHRLLQTLVQRQYMRQLPNRRYALGVRLVSLGVAANRQIGASSRSLLADLVCDLGETANLAVLSGDRAEYIEQVPSPHPMRMFTEVGARVELHCTGVGKVLLSQLSDMEAGDIVRRTGLAAHTSKTLVTQTSLFAALHEIRERGYAMDEEEQAIGVRCVAVPVMFGTALSIAGPVARVTDEVVARAVPLLTAAARQLASDVTD